MKKQTLLVGAMLLTSIPVGLLLPGCGGGGGGLLNPTQTYAANLVLSPSQRAQLALRVTGGTASGTLVVPQFISVAGRKTAALTEIIGPGTYPLTGTVSGTFTASTTSPTATGTGTITPPTTTATGPAATPRVNGTTITANIFS